MTGQIDKELPASYQHTDQEQGSGLEETAMSPTPQQAEKLSVPQVRLHHHPEVRLSQEGIHISMMHQPLSRSSHIVGIVQRIKELCPFYRLKHQENSRYQHSFIAPFANQGQDDTYYRIQHQDITGEECTIKTSDQKQQE